MESITLLEGGRPRSRIQKGWLTHIYFPLTSTLRGFKKENMQYRAEVYGYDEMIKNIEMKERNMQYLMRYIPKNGLLNNLSKDQSYNFD